MYWVEARSARADPITHIKFNFRLNTTRAHKANNESKITLYRTPFINYFINPLNQTDLAVNIEGEKYETT